MASATARLLQNSTGNGTASTSWLLSEYDSGYFVRQAKVIPQVSRALAELGGVTGSDPKFDPTSLKYLATIVALPATVFLLGILSMFFMNLGLLMRFCSRTFSCYPWSAGPYTKHRRQGRLVAALSFFSLLLLVTAGLLYLADGNLDLGVAETQGLLRVLYILLKSLQADTERMASECASLASRLIAVKSSCTVGFNSLSPGVASLNSETSRLYGLVNAIVTQVEVMSFYVDNYLASQSRRSAIYALGAIPIILATSFVAAGCCRCSAALKMLIAVGIVWFYLSTLLALPVMIGTSLLADLCSDPFSKILYIAPSQGRVFNLTRYYTTCEGESVAQGYLDAARVSSLGLNASINAILSSPPGDCHGSDANLIAMRKHYVAIGVSIAAGEAHLPRCKHLRSVYVPLVDEAVCHYLFLGLLETGAALLAGGLCLWLCVFLGSLLSPHFDPAFFEQVYISHKDDDDDDDYDDDDDDDDDDDWNDEGRRGRRTKGTYGDDDEEGKGAEDRLVAAELSLAEKEGRQTEFDWASLSEELSQSAAEKSQPGHAFIAELFVKIPDEEEEEEEERAAAAAAAATTAGEVEFGSESLAGDGVSVLTGFNPRVSERNELSGEERLHEVAVVPIGREDDL